jgi:ethanolamine transporter EutH
MKKTIFICGLIGGLIVTWWMIAAMAGLLNPYFENGMLLGYATMLVAFSLIFVAVKNSRDKYNGGFISFGKALKIGLLITLVASTIYVLVWLIDYYYFIPDFFDKYAAHMLAKMKAAGASAAEMQEQAAAIQGYTQMYKNPLFNAMFTYLEILPVGIIVSLLAAVILKRKPDAAKMMEANPVSL